VKPQNQTTEVCKAKDNPSSIGSLKAFETPIAQNVVINPPVSDHTIVQYETITDDTQPTIKNEQPST